jgi:hypothetical protein
LALTASRCDPFNGGMLDSHGIRRLLKSLRLFSGILIAATCHAESAEAPSASPSGIANPVSAAPGTLSVVWTATQPVVPVKNFTPEELNKLKMMTTTEQDPVSGKKTKFSGILLSDVIDKALAGTGNERKAQIDLVVLKNAQGALALIPRSFLVKYPVILAHEQDHHKLGGLRSVVPWTSHSKTRSEALPLDTYFISDVNEVDLANYEERYGEVFLKRRTDPVAVRGEKIFVQSCLSCHDSAPGISKARDWVGQHPTVHGAPELDERARRALRDYFDLFKAEATPKATALR